MKKEPARPVILSASRVTDIPAFYMPWFLNRLKEGYSVRVNPYNGKRQCLSYEKARIVVFWSKNPAPLLSSIHTLEERGLGFYLHFTLNDYEQEGWEPGLPSLKKRMQDFRDLSVHLGKERVIWRFDPLILSPLLSISELARRIMSIGEELVSLTDRLVISFLDISPYKSVIHRLKKGGSPLRAPTEEEEAEFIDLLSRLQCQWKDVNPSFSISLCAERDWESRGIEPARCIDGDLLKKLYPYDSALQDYLKKARKDPSQRPLCRCIESRDIGAYGTCRFACIYCYARSTRVPLLKEDFTKESLSDMIKNT